MERFETFGLIQPGTEFLSVSVYVYLFRKVRLRSFTQNSNLHLVGQIEHEQLPLGFKSLKNDHQLWLITFRVRKRLSLRLRNKVVKNYIASL